MGNESRKKRKEQEKRREQEKQAQHAKRRGQVQLRPVPRAMPVTAPAKMSTNTAATPPETAPTPPPPPRDPSLPPTFSNEGQGRGRSQHRSPSPARSLSLGEESSVSPPPTPKRKRAREVSGLDDKEICARYSKLTKTLATMDDDNVQRHTSSSIYDYHDKARLIPRLIHPFINVHEALTFGLTYQQDDFDWDAEAEDEDMDEEDAQEDAGEDDEESPKAKRARELAHKKELFYQYNALLDMIPGLKTDIHLMNDEEVELLAEYLQKVSAKARGTDSSHIAGRIITYMHAATDMPRDDVPKLPAILTKGLRGYANHHTARALIPPNFINSFDRHWERVCDMILKKEVRIPGDDWPSFLFDLDVYNDPRLEDSDLEALLRSALFKMIYKSLWTGAISVSMDGGRPDKVPGKPPIRMHYKLREVTPRSLAYTAILTREALTTHDWSLVDLDFNNSQFFEGLVDLFDEPRTAWAKKTLEWWNSEVYGNLSPKATRNLTKGRQTMAQKIRSTLKQRKAHKAGKAVANSSSPSPEDAPPEEEERSDDIADIANSSGSGAGPSDSPSPSGSPSGSRASDSE
ncbi:hypothetical protein C8T65DRAFT_699193 [Cerioporus squamosus]|nr:hypothetical protein C8T65DRAFT_699193 [Cerioporus squamosus]